MINHNSDFQETKIPINILSEYANQSKFNSVEMTDNCTDCNIMYSLKLVTETMIVTISLKG